MTREEFEVFKVTATLQRRCFVFDNPWTDLREFWTRGELSNTRLRERCNGIAHHVWGEYAQPFFTDSWRTR